jgi:hypothetical protein
MINHGHWPAVFVVSNPSAWELTFWILVSALGVYRVARIIAQDSVSDKSRHRLEAHYHGSLVTLVNCIWCLSFWLAIVAAVLTYFDATRPWWILIAAVLSISTIAGLISERG